MSGQAGHGYVRVCRIGTSRILDAVRDGFWMVASDRYVTDLLGGRSRILDAEGVGSGVMDL